ncbi:Hypothetical protein SmN45_3527 [Serratia marcescens]|nr:Hypothetical protein SmN45_3527 [Serratia marcescens]
MESQPRLNEKSYHLDAPVCPVKMPGCLPSGLRRAVNDYDNGL